MKNRNLSYYAARFILAAGVSASVLTGCSDMKEPDSIVNLRNAKAEEVQAIAAKELAEAKVEEAKAAVEAAKVAGEEASAAVLKATAAAQELQNKQTEAENAIKLAIAQDVQADSLKTLKARHEAELQAKEKEAAEAKQKAEEAIAAAKEKNAIIAALAKNDPATAMKLDAKETAKTVLDADGNPVSTENEFKTGMSTELSTALKDYTNANDTYLKSLETYNNTVTAQKATSLAALKAEVVTETRRLNDAKKDKENIEKMKEARSTDALYKQYVEDDEKIKTAQAKIDELTEEADNLQKAQTEKQTAIDNLTADIKKEVDTYETTEKIYSFPVKDENLLSYINLEKDDDVIGIQKDYLKNYVLPYFKWDDVQNRFISYENGSVTKISNRDLKGKIANLFNVLNTTFVKVAEDQTKKLNTLNEALKKSEEALAALKVKKEEVDNETAITKKDGLKDTWATAAAAYDKTMKDSEATDAKKTVVTEDLKKASKDLFGKELTIIELPKNEDVAKAYSDWGKYGQMLKWKDKITADAKSIEDDKKVIAAWTKKTAANKAAKTLYDEIDNLIKAYNQAKSDFDYRTSTIIESKEYAAAEAALKEVLKQQEENIAAQKVQSDAKSDAEKDKNKIENTLNKDYKYIYYYSEVMGEGIGLSITHDDEYFDEWCEKALQDVQLDIDKAEYNKKVAEENVKFFEAGDYASISSNLADAIKTAADQLKKDEAEKNEKEKKYNALLEAYNAAH